MTETLPDMLARCKIIDLAVEYFHGMPYIPATPAFQYGLLKEHGDAVSADGISSSSDQVLMHLHAGTHIDAFCHYSRHDSMFGGYSASGSQNKWKGFCVHGVNEIGPIVRRGVLLDIAKSRGVERLPPGTAIDATMLETAAKAEGVCVQAGDVVLIRTGEIQLWPDQAYYDATRGGIAGIDLSAAHWLSDRGVYLVGSDNFCIEHIPAPAKGKRASGMPVHGHLLVDKGIHLLEVMNLEELAASAPKAFTFVASPLKVRGATGAPVRPLALVR